MSLGLILVIILVGLSLCYLVPFCSRVLDKRLITKHLTKRVP